MSQSMQNQPDKIVRFRSKDRSAVWHEKVPRFDGFRHEEIVVEQNKVFAQSGYLVERRLDRASIERFTQTDFVVMNYGDTVYTAWLLRMHGNYENASEPRHILLGKLQ